jgi:signal transduction histidine kinase
MLVHLLLVNGFQLFLWWGPKFCQIYNDAAHPILGKKHPKSMGQPASECWAEIWHIIGPLIETPYRGGDPTWMEDILLEMNRHGFMEETHFTIAYSPVPDSTVPSKIGGVLGTVHEITEKVIGERRLMLLRNLGARSAEAKTAEEACVIAADTLVQHTKDVPFSLLYLVDADRKRVHLAGAAGVDCGEVGIPLVVELRDCRDKQRWPLGEVFNDGAMRIVQELSEQMSKIPPGPWTDPPHSAVVLPIQSNIAHQFAGLLVLGISARLQFDDKYRVFCELVSSQVATAITNARAYEEERKRAEALAENLRTLNGNLTRVQEEERRRLALELHDGAGQWLAALTWKLAPLRDEVGESELGKLASDSLHLLDELSREIRTVSHLLHPALLDESGLASALPVYIRALETRSGLVVNLDIDPSLQRLPKEMESAIFRIVQESLTNIHRHARSKSAEVRIKQDAEAVHVQVRDQGRGIRGFTSLDQPNVQLGVGVQGMRERVRQLKGSFDIESGPGGTTVTAVLPSKRRSQDAATSAA